MRQALKYLPQTAEFRRELPRRQLNLRVILEATDAKPPAFVEFRGESASAGATTSEDADDPSRWDVKVTGSSRDIFGLFLGTSGTLRPLLFRRVKVKKLVGALRMIHFVKLCQKVLQKNLPFATAVFEATIGQFVDKP